MKANHNAQMAQDFSDQAVTNLNISKNESKSQPDERAARTVEAVTNLNISKNESKSQLYGSI